MATAAVRTLRRIGSALFTAAGTSRRRQAAATPRALDLTAAVTARCRRTRRLTFSRAPTVAQAAAVGASTDGARRGRATARATAATARRPFRDPRSSFASATTERRCEQMPKPCVCCSTVFVCWWTNVPCCVSLQTLLEPRRQAGRRLALCTVHEGS